MLAVSFFAVLYPKAVLFVNMRTLLIICTELVAVTHLTMSVILFIYSRRSVAYLAQAWTTMLTFVIYGVALFFVATLPESSALTMGMFHPALLLALLVTSFLLSINPLGMVMPGYLQAPRMVKYALPAAAIIVLYFLGLVVGSRPVHIDTFDTLRRSFLSGDVLLRVASLLLSMYYILNIIILPHRLIRKSGYSLPANVVSYASLLGFVQLLFVCATLWISYPLVLIYEVLFTAVSLMLTGCMIKANISVLPYPDIHPVEAPPTLQEITQTEQEDFNAANLQRFQTIEYAMQHGKPYVAFDFNRDRLCRLSGFNRHIVLQALRSQGYNDVHDYISRYRVSELRRLIEVGDVTDIRQHECVGFRTLKTAVLAFERYEHVDLQQFIERCNNDRTKAGNLPVGVTETAE